MSQTEPQDYSDIDLVFLFIDYGDPFLRQATTEMLRSAQAAMPGINIVQVRDGKSRLHPFAKAERVFGDVPREDLAAFKGIAFATHAMETDRPTIFADVDLIWNNAGAADDLREMSEPHIAVMRRLQDEFAVQPFNTGMILFRPAAPRFWAEYRRMCESCKDGFRAWWADQLALSAMIGYREDDTFAHVADANVYMLDMNRNCPAPDTLPTERMTSWATHFKGARRKEWLVKYARVLDGGAHFDALDPARFDEIVRQHA